MFDVGGGELLFILFVVLLLFGPKKIPELAQMIGKGMQQLKKAQSQLQSQISDIQSEIKTVAEADNTVKANPPYNTNGARRDSDYSSQEPTPEEKELDDIYNLSSNNSTVDESVITEENVTDVSFNSSSTEQVTNDTDDAEIKENSKL